jgi:pyridoxal phosphate enzyme (YggS family)
MSAVDAGVHHALSLVRRRITAAAERAGRDPAGVTLIAATKTVAPERIVEVVLAGVRDLGENRVQEAVSKRPRLPAEVRWHLIGHLQTNKAGRAAAIFDTVHSVDGERIAAALDARRPPELPPLEVLLEVELTGLPGHTGYRPEELAAAVDAVAGRPRLRILGLMTMAAPVDDPELARPYFRRLRQLRDQVEERTGRRLPELSMGMSDDFEVAVEEGATMVRVGRALFGARPPRPGPGSSGA